MTDVRDPDPVIELKTPEVDVSSRQPLVSRQSLVSRALAPIRRVTGREPDVASSREIEPINRDPFAPLPKRNYHLVRWSLITVVLLPTIAAAIYLFLIATDQYVAEARFAVQQAGSTSTSSGGDNSGMDGSSSSSSGSSSSGGGFGTAGASTILSGAPDFGGKNAEIVANYIHSRAIIDDISRHLDVRAIYQRPEADFWARLPKDATAEDLTLYWSKMIGINVESSSGIVTLDVSAFRREDALALANAILQSSERLVNNMSLKIRTDLMKTAEDEVRRSEGEVRFALANLTNFRNSEHLVDPVKSSDALGKLLLQLMGTKVDTEAQVFVAERSQGPNAPGLNTVRAKLQSVSGQIEDIKDQMAGGKKTTGNMAATLSQFETLDLKRQFAETLYGFARNGVERARITAESQQIYLEVFVPPSLPQDYSYPLRFADLLLVGLGCLMLWIVGATATASVLDHQL